MKSGDKRTEKAIIKALISVCETCEGELTGFSWLTHFVDYSKFPQSLKIVLVFETIQNLNNAKNNSDLEAITQLVNSNLLDQGVSIKELSKAIFFDTEENGADVDNLKWGRKFIR